MVSRPDWMTNVDVRILELLAGTTSIKPGGLWLQPKALSFNLTIDRSYTYKRLKKLAEEGMVDSEDGMYRISEQGYHYIQSAQP